MLNSSLWKTGGKAMKYFKATKDYAEQVYKLVQDTIYTIYPKYYPMPVVKFFGEHHSLEKITKDIENGDLGVLLVNENLVGTGSSHENHITRVFVFPEYQRQGYGSYIMQQLEDEIALSFDTAILDASLPSCQLYEKRGYRTTKYEKIALEEDVFLVYGIMEKSFATKKPTNNDE